MQILFQLIHKNDKENMISFIVNQYFYEVPL